MKLKRTRVVVTLTILGFAFIVGYGVFKGGKKQQQMKRPTFVVRAMPPVFGEIADVLPYVGNIEGDTQTTVYSRAPGKLLKNEVAEGQWVDAGAVIALVDRDDPGFVYKPTQVTTPVAGVVAKLFLQDKGAQVFVTTPVALVVNALRVRVNLNVAEEDYPKVFVGQRVGLRVDAYPSREFYGFVQSKSATIDTVTHTGRAVVVVDNGGRSLTPGMYAKVGVYTSVKRAWKLPNSAIVLSEEGNYVFVDDKGHARRRPVSIGIRTTDDTEILGGVDAADSVVYEGTGLLSEGLAITNIGPKKDATRDRADQGDKLDKTGGAKP